MGPASQSEEEFAVGETSEKGKRGKGEKEEGNPPFQTKFAAPGTPALSR